MEDAARAIADVDVCLWTVEQQLNFVDASEDASNDVSVVSKIINALNTQENPPSLRINESHVRGIRALQMITAAGESPQVFARFSF